jgi:hypothetical protein
MTDHEPPFDVEGDLPVIDGKIKIPDEYGSNATMHTTHSTVVRYVDKRTTYDTAHPELNPDDQQGVFVAFQKHGTDEWTYYRLVPLSRADDDA